MNTLEHLTRIASNDQNHIRDLKSGFFGSLSQDVMDAMYPNDRWMIIQELPDIWIVTPLTHFRNINGPMCIIGMYWYKSVYPEYRPAFTKHYSGANVWSIPVPENGPIPVRNSWYRSDFDSINRDFLTEKPYCIAQFDNPPTELVKFAITKNPKVYYLLENPSDEITEHAIRCCSMMAFDVDPKWLNIALESTIYFTDILTKIDNPTEEQCWIVLRKDPLALRWIKNQTEDMKWFALKKYTCLFPHIQNPTDDMKWYAIKNYYWALKYIESPTYEMQKEAIRRYPCAMRFIKNPTEEMYKIVSESCCEAPRLAFIPESKWTDELIERSLCSEINRNLLLDKPDLTKKWKIKLAEYGTCKEDCDIEIAKIAVKVSPFIMTRYLYHDIDIQKELIRANPMCLKHASSSWELCHLAVSLDRCAIIWVNNREWIAKLKAQFF